MSRELEEVRQQVAIAKKALEALEATERRLVELAESERVKDLVERRVLVRVVCPMCEGLKVISRSRPCDHCGEQGFRHGVSFEYVEDYQTLKHTAPHMIGY